MVCHQQASESAQNCRVQGPVLGTQQAGGVAKDAKRDLSLWSYEASVFFLFFLSFPPPDRWLWTARSGSRSLSTGHSGEKFTVCWGMSRGQGGHPECVKLSVRGCETVRHSSQVRQGLQQCGVTACPVQGRSESRGCSWDKGGYGCAYRRELGREGSELNSLALLLRSSNRGSLPSLSVSALLKANLQHLGHVLNPGRVFMCVWSCMHTHMDANLRCWPSGIIDLI